MTEVVPFSATEEEHSTIDTLPVDTITVDSLLAAIPKFKDVVRGNLLVQWAILPVRGEEKVLTYHIYKLDRKNIFDAAEKALQDTKCAEDKHTISIEANAALEEVPWWSGFEENLQQALNDHFKTITGRYGYYLEVDSWSVSINITDMFLAVWPESFIEAFVDRLKAKIEG